VNNLQKEIQNIEEKINTLRDEADEELKSLVEEEIKSLETQKKALEEAVLAVEQGGTGAGAGSEGDEVAGSVSGATINPNVAIMEIRSGTGGAEASIFAADLHRMYTRHAEKVGWKMENLFKSESEHDGLKTITLQFSGKNAYTLLKNESGVHRVQRVPVTESSGRVHTSAATVAVLPRLKSINIEIKPEDLNWEFYRSGGKGGQNVNKVSTAVRLTHKPTGIVIESQEERKQGKNREKALDMLKSNIYTQMEHQQVQNISELRSSQVGSGDRSEKIRTYNFPQDRITDHRLGKNFHNMAGVMDGSIEKILTACSTL
jgi:peptide chain release factor 1